MGRKSAEGLKCGSGEVKGSSTKVGAGSPRPEVRRNGRREESGKRRKDPDINMWLMSYGFCRFFLRKSLKSISAEIV